MVAVLLVPWMQCQICEGSSEVVNVLQLLSGVKVQVCRLSLLTGGVPNGVAFGRCIAVQFRRAVSRYVCFVVVGCKEVKGAVKL